MWKYDVTEKKAYEIREALKVQRAEILSQGIKEGIA
jgi:hypothetical protein